MPGSSWIWKHFKKCDTTAKVECILCKKEFSFKGGNGTLVYHLEKVHLLSDKLPSTPASVKRDASGRKVMPKEAGNMSSYVTSLNARPCSSARACTLTSLLVDCVTLDLLPLSFGEGEGMKKLLSYCEPNYQVPTGTTIRSHLLQKFEKDKQNLMERLKSFDRKPAITCDAWTNSQMVGFLSVMVHYIDDSWNILLYNLSSPNITGRHTAIHLAEILDGELEKADIQAFCATHDNAANMKAALRRTERIEYNVGCFAHLLSLGVKDGIAEATAAEKIVKKVHCVIGKVSSNEMFLKEFRKLRDSFLPEQKECELQLSVETRWNSIYTMLRSFMDLYLAFITTTKVPGIVKISDKQDFTFDSMEESIIGDILMLLEILKLVTDVWEGDKYVTVSAVYPILFSVVKQLKDMKVTTQEGEKLRSALIANLQFRFSMLDLEFLSTLSIHVCASYLDPRFKDLGFLDSSAKQSVMQILLEKVRQNMSGSCEPQMVDPGNDSPKKLSKLTMLLSSSGSKKNSSRSLEQEFALYDLDPSTSPDLDPLCWWKTNENRFPRIAKLAKLYLQIPATSASSERLFSLMGNIYNEKRMNLRLETAEAIVFLHHNNST